MVPEMRSGDAIAANVATNASNLLRIFEEYNVPNLTRFSNIVKGCRFRYQCTKISGDF